MKKILALSVLATSLISGVAFADGSPWVPEHGGLNLSASVVSGSTDTFLIGGESTELGGDLSGTFVWLNGSYGYDDIWAFDFRTGYAESSFEGNFEDQSDINDTTFGVRYQFINEFEADNGWPTITGRLAYTIGGDYETDIIEAIGDGASGFDVSLLIGKSIAPQISLFGDATYRQRDDNVADALKLLIGASYSTPIPRLSLQGSYGLIRTDSDIDIGGPGFGVEQFPQTDREQDLLIAGGNYGFGNGISVGASFQALLSGRNVADTNVIGITAGYSF